MKRGMIVSLIVIMLAATTTLSAWDVEYAGVSVVYVGSHYGQYVYFNTYGSHVGEYRFRIDTNQGRIMYATLLSAKVQKIKVCFDYDSNNTVTRLMIH